MNTNDDFVEIDNGRDDDILKLVATLWLRRFWIILCVLLFASIAFAMAMLRVPMYQATALVQLETKSSGVQLSTDIAEMLTSESEAVTEIEILKSRLVLGKVVDALDLDTVAVPLQLPIVGNLIRRLGLDRPDFQWLSEYGWSSEAIEIESLTVPEHWLGQQLEITKTEPSGYQMLLPDTTVITGGVGQSLVDNSRGLSLNLSRLEGDTGSVFLVKRLGERSAVNALRSKITVSEKPRSSGIISIDVISQDPSLSENIAATMVQAYVAQNIERSAEEADRSLAFLRQQLPLVKRQLEYAEAELNSFRLESASIDLDYEAQSILEKTVSLDAQLSALSLEESELSRRFTTSHPNYRVLLEKKALLEAEKAGLANSVQELPGTQQEILRKTRDVEVNQQIYVQLLHKSQELSIMKAGAVGNVRLIDQASANPAPVSPKVPLMTAIGAVFGAMFAIAAALLRQNFHRAIDSPEDLKKINAPMRAVIPLSKVQERFDRRGKPVLLSKKRPNEMAVEAVRGLRTTLGNTPFGEGHNIISVTGPSPGVGKSFIASNLAYLTARAGAKVLLIDGDLRRGGLGTLYNLPRDVPGFAQLLNGSSKPSATRYKVDLDALQLLAGARAPRERRSTYNVSANRKNQMTALAMEMGYGRDDSTLDTAFDDTYAKDSTLEIVESSFARKAFANTRDATPSISVIPRGLLVRNPSELLMSHRLPRFLEYVSRQFDVVVIDTPPVLAATDAMILGRFSDTNLMVVRHGETSVHEAEEVARTFNNNGIRLNGIVLNGFDLRHSRYGNFGAQYGYQYAYD